MLISRCVQKEFNKIDFFFFSDSISQERVKKKQTNKQHLPLFTSFKMKVDFQDWMFCLRRSGTQPFTNHIRTRTHTGLRCHRNSALRMIPIKLLIISHTLNLTDSVQVSDRHTHRTPKHTNTSSIYNTNLFIS